MMEMQKMELTTVTPKQSLAYSVQKWISWRPTQKPHSTLLMHVMIHVAPSHLIRSSAKKAILIFAIRVAAVLTHSGTAQVQLITLKPTMINFTERALISKLTALRNSQ